MHIRLIVMATESAVIALSVTTDTFGDVHIAVTLI